MTHFQTLILAKLNQVTTHGYDANGWELYRHLGDGQQFSFSYDARGAMLTAYDTTGTTTNTYDAIGGVKTTLGPDYPSGWPLTLAYYGSGNRIGMAGWFDGGTGMGSGGMFTYAFDQRNQLLSVADHGYPSLGTASGYTTLAYDQRGHMAKQQNPNGTACQTPLKSEPVYAV